MPKILRAPRIERCIGCHSCSLACARLVYKKLSWNTAGIRIHSSGGMSTGFEPNMCLACDPAPCVLACPTCAFSQRPGGGVRRKMELCIRCGKCAEACPVDAVYLDPDSVPYVCVQCGQCPKYCPHQCLEMIEAGLHHERENAILAEETAHKPAQCAVGAPVEHVRTGFDDRVGPVPSPDPGREKEVPNE